MNEAMVNPPELKTFSLGYPNNQTIQIKDKGEQHLIEGTPHLHIQWLGGDGWIEGYIPCSLVSLINQNRDWNDQHMKRIDKRAELNELRDTVKAAVEILTKRAP